MCPPLDILIGPGLPLSVAHATGRRDRIGAAPSAWQRRASSGAAGVLPVQRRGVRHVGGDPAVRLRADRSRIGRRRGVRSSSSRRRCSRRPRRHSATGSRANGCSRRATSRRRPRCSPTASAMILAAPPVVIYAIAAVAASSLVVTRPTQIGAAAVAGRVTGGADGGQRGERDRGRCRCPGRAD